ncbi:MAG: FAD-binding oxidoreductase [Saprospiraceae bacterium]|nr:FAD-binding oxidoreductase [Saprospiraceae bacterium]
MVLSFWEKEFIQEKFDVTILGAGITGTSTALSLVEKYPELKVCVIDRAPVSLGASTKNAGFACFGSPTELIHDISVMGEQKTADIVKMRWLGLKKLLSRVPEEKMFYQQNGGYEVFDHGDSSFAMVEKKLEYLNQFLAETIGAQHVFSLENNTIWSSFYQKMIFNPFEGSLQPAYMMSFLQSLARQKGVVFKTGVSVKEVIPEQKLLISEEGFSIPFQKLCITTNGFTKTLFPEVNVFPARNQVLITRELADLPFSGCFHYQEGYYYYRNVGNRILLGGARNTDIQNESTDQFGNTLKIQHELMRFLERLYPGASENIEMWWSGILGIGNVKEPILSWKDEDIILGVRLGGMGVAIGSFLGDKLAGEIGISLGYTE